MAIHYTVTPQKSLAGELTIPGDKSISHRALLLAAIATGTSTIKGFLASADTLATLEALTQMGVSIECQDDVVSVHGVGFDGLQAPKQPLNLGNSGTAARLLTGLLCGQQFDSILIGDDSLMQRPMQRVITPLQNMNAMIKASPQATMPLYIYGRPLKAIDYTLPIASAQLKSALLLAGLYAEGETKIQEKTPTRDHTERMLKLFTQPLSCDHNNIGLQPIRHLQATEIEIPADFSSAAFFIVAACLVPNSDITIKNVGYNQTRTALLDIIRLMGAHVEILNIRHSETEPIADIRIHSQLLHGIEIPEELIPIAIDELPILCIAAAMAEGKTVLRGATELRVKESDRIQAIAHGLQVLGIEVQELADGMIISGSKTLQSGKIESYGDHRIAMAFTIIAHLAKAPVQIKNCDNVATSFPDFVAQANSIGFNIATHAT